MARLLSKQRAGWSGFAWKLARSVDALVALMLLAAHAVLAMPAAPADERYAKRRQNGTTNSFHSMSRRSGVRHVGGARMYEVLVASRGRIRVTAGAGTREDS
ncbi:hypothetical protein [Paraburkholderia ultramafica]|uniref:hypothetical protein n=1 Tax=Paraburkholderia ultramafica TaxID=1544867 RepID=UPI0015841A1A|nr:hypothetical protein [Paraburkholderia ultramafica]